MKTRIRSIFWLMTVCILGINLFQAYWLYTTYQLHYQQFSRTVKEAMFEALQKQQLSEAQRFVGQKRFEQGHSERIFYRQFTSESPDIGPIMIAERHDSSGLRLQTPVRQPTKHKIKITKVANTQPRPTDIQPPKPQFDTTKTATLKLKIANSQLINDQADTINTPVSQRQIIIDQLIKHRIDTAKITVVRLRIPGDRLIKYHIDTAKTTTLHLQSTDSQPVSPRSAAKITVEVRSTNQHRQPTADSMARRLSDLLVFRWSEGQAFDLKKMASIYEAELKRRDVESDFVLDTFSIKAPQRAVSIINLPMVKEDNAIRAGFAIRTPPVPINPVKGKFLQASFKTPTSYILRRMGWILGSSVLLLVLTTGCFLFMLSTILQQKKLSEIKNDFINNMTHELKTPIATVSAAVEAMQYFGALNDPKKTETYLTISRNELQRLSDLVEKVLNMAVEEQRELTLYPQPINPAELVQELVQRHQLKAAKPVAFQVDVSPDSVVIDQIHVGNVINNLIDNAIKYSKEQVLIRIHGGYQSDNWQLSVADDGIGIPKGYQEAIFDRFFRVPTGNLHPVKGFGLGLYYVRQVVERHRGTIEVTSEAGKGSEFVITLPQKDV